MTTLPSISYVTSGNALPFYNPNHGTFKLPPLMGEDPSYRRESIPLDMEAFSATMRVSRNIGVDRDQRTNAHIVEVPFANVIVLLRHDNNSIGLLFAHKHVILLPKVVRSIGRFPITFSHRPPSHPSQHQTSGKSRRRRVPSQLNS